MVRGIFIKVRPILGAKKKKKTNQSFIFKKGRYCIRIRYNK